MADSNKTAEEATQSSQAKESISKKIDEIKAIISNAEGKFDEITRKPAFIISFASITLGLIAIAFISIFTVHLVLEFMDDKVTRTEFQGPTNYCSCAGNTDKDLYGKVADMPNVVQGKIEDRNTSYSNSDGRYLIIPTKWCKSSDKNDKETSLYVYATSTTSAAPDSCSFAEQLTIGSTHLFYLTKSSGILRAALCDNTQIFNSAEHYNSVQKLQQQNQCQHDFGEDFMRKFGIKAYIVVLLFACVLVLALVTFVTIQIIEKVTNKSADDEGVPSQEKF